MVVGSTILVVVVVVVVVRYQDRTGQDQAGLFKTGRERTGPDRTRPDKTNQDRTAGTNRKKKTERTGKDVVAKSLERKAGPCQNQSDLIQSTNENTNERTK